MSASSDSPRSPHRDEALRSQHQHHNQQSEQDDVLVLEAEVHAKKTEDKQAAKFYTDAGGYAPTIGIIGTVMGMVHVLENLTTPAALGPLIAGAFVATLWGVGSANLLFLPLGSRLKRLGALEAARMELTVEGISAIQSGSNPRLVAEKLKSLLPADQQNAEEAA